MTLIASLSNGKIAGVITDKRKIIEGNETEDITDKLKIISGSNFRGVLGWTGDTQTANETLSYIRNVSEDIKLVDFGLRIAKEVDKYINNVLREKLDGTRPEDRDTIIKRTLDAKLAEFSLVAYQKSQEHDEIRIGSVAYSTKDGKFNFDYIDNFHFEMGGGGSIANNHIKNQLKGRQFEELNQEEILCLLAGAYIESTRIATVGGIPKFALIGEKGIQTYSNEEGCALCRLVGNWNMGIIQGKDEDWLYKQIKAIREKNPDYQSIAEATYETIPHVKAYCPTYNQLTETLRSFKEQGIIPKNGH